LIIVTDEAFLSATRDSYDTVAASYAALVPAVADDHPMNRAVLGAFVDRVRGEGAVADIGCGTGRVTAYLHAAGLDVVGIDVSPGMLAVARRDHPALRFVEGSMLSLDLPDGQLAGVVAWYSFIHLPPSRLPVAFSEFYRVLAPHGYLQLGFHVGDRCIHKTSGYGHDGISLDVHRLPVDRVCSLLEGAGFVIDTEVLQRADGDKAPQAAVFARKH
jgi:SAM-dependent methyltransferase